MFTNYFDEGAEPSAGVALSGTVLYGTTYSGGSFGIGTVFKMNTDGTDYTVLKHFGSDIGDGQNPWAALLCRRRIWKWRW